MNDFSSFLNVAPQEYWGKDPKQLRELALANGLGSESVRRAIEQVGHAARHYATTLHKANARNGRNRGSKKSSRQPADGKSTRSNVALDAPSLQMRNWLSLAWALDPAATLHRLRMDGLLRASTWEWNTEIPQILLSDCLRMSLAGARPPSHPTDRSVDPTKALCLIDPTYLRSIKVMWGLAPILSRIEEAELNILRRERQEGVFGLLATVELIYANHGPPPAWAKRWPVRLAADVGDATGEIAILLAEAATYALRRYTQCIGPLRDDPNRKPTNGRVAERGTYLSRLASWALLTRAREWEELIDVHNYSASQETRRLVSIRPPSDEYEKCVRHGFLQAQQQQAIAPSEGREAISIADFTRRILQDHPSAIRTERRQQPLPRHLIAFGAYDRILPVLSTPKVFAEEAAMLDSVMAEHLLTPDEIRTFAVAEGVTLWDLILVQRLFRLINTAVRQAIKNDVLASLPVAIHSMLPTLSKEKLNDLLSAMLGKDARSVISFLTAREEEPGFDLHYQPLIALSDDGYVVCPFILGHANLIRNAWQSSKTRAHRGKTPDPAEDLLVEVIRGSGGCAIANLKFSHGGKKGEFDVLACLDGICFAIEFKRTILPGSIRELRGSLEPMQKAAHQLERIQEAWASREFRDYLSRILARENWSSECCEAVRKADVIQSAIILSNRMYSGWRERGHPVRGINELLTFLLKGEIEVRVLDHSDDVTDVPSSYTARTWSGERIRGDDLKQYLAADLIHDVVKRSMLPITRELFVGTTRVVEFTFALELMALGEAVREAFGEGAGG